jgi:hypothetical protein
LAETRCAPRRNRLKPAHAIPVTKRPRNPYSCAAAGRNAPFLPCFGGNGAGIEHVNRVAEIRLLAERQMGIFLRGMDKAIGSRKVALDSYEGQRPEKTGSHWESVSDHMPALAEIGITKKQSARAKKFAAVPENGFRKTIAEAIASVGRLTVQRQPNACGAAESEQEPAKAKTPRRRHDSRK